MVEVALISALLARVAALERILFAYSDRDVTCAVKLPAALKLIFSAVNESDMARMAVLSISAMPISPAAKAGSADKYPDGKFVGEDCSAGLALMSLESVPVNRLFMPKKCERPKLSGPTLLSNSLKATPVAGFTAVITSALSAFKAAVTSGNALICAIRPPIVPPERDKSISAVDWTTPLASVVVTRKKPVVATTVAGLKPSSVPVNELTAGEDVP